MRSNGNNFNYFPENKLTKLANLAQFIHMLMFCLKDWGLGSCLSPLGYATVMVTPNGERSEIVPRQGAALDEPSTN